MPAAGTDDHWDLFLALYFEPKLNSLAKQSDQFIILCKHELAYSLFKTDKVGNDPEFNRSHWMIFSLLASLTYMQVDSATSVMAKQS